MAWHLVVERGCRKGMSVPVTAKEFRIGRSTTCQLRPASNTVAWVHCIVKQWHGRLFVESGSGSTATFVNGQRIACVTELHAGDRLAIGPLVFSVCANTDEERLPVSGSSRQEESFGNLLLSLDESPAMDSSLADTGSHTALSSQDTVTDQPASGSVPRPGELKPAVVNTTGAAAEILRQYLRRPR